MKTLPVFLLRGRIRGIAAGLALAVLTAVAASSREPEVAGEVMGVPEGIKLSVSKPEQGSPVIRVETRLVYVPDAEAHLVNESLGDATSTVPLPASTAEALFQRLLERPGVEIVPLPTVTTGSGSDFQIDLTAPARYASRFTPQGEAAAFETRAVGFQLEATPAIAPDGESLQLAFTFKVTQMRDAGRGGKSALLNGGRPGRRWLDRLLETTPPDNNRDQPVFSLRRVAATLSCWDGQTLISPGVPTVADRDDGEVKGRAFIALTPVIVRNQPVEPAKHME